MDSKKVSSILIGLVAVLIVLGGIYYFSDRDSSDISDNQPDTESENTGVQQEDNPDSNDMMDDSTEETGSEEVQEETVQEFVIDADDNAFYQNGEDLSSLSVNSGEVRITFNVLEEDVYYGGLDFRGCGFDSDDTSPGNSVTVEFTVESDCTIISYWPSSGVEKDSMDLIVQ